MLSEESLVKEFSQYGTVAGGELYLDIRKALDFVAACQNNNLAVIGVEGFIRDGSGVHPQLDLIADYSSAKESTWEKFRDLCNSSAMKFLTSIPLRPGLLFSFTIKGEVQTGPAPERRT